jgi:hypothetical protein
MRVTAEAMQAPMIFAAFGVAVKSQSTRTLFRYIQRVAMKTLHI